MNKNVMASIILGMGVVWSGVSYANDNDFLPPVKDCKVIAHHNYTLCFNSKYKDALWVSYELTDQELAKNFKRTNDFKPDNLVRSASLSDYSHSGYDRGHLAPAGDMEFSKVAIHESFYLSNMTPQIPAFNRGIWKNLESQVRMWAKTNHKIYVITAGILKGDKYIGSDRVLVPNMFYKIIYAPQQNKAIAFLLPNKASKKPLESFIVPIKTLDKLTHIDFLKNLSANQINQPANPHLWTWANHGKSYKQGYHSKRRYAKSYHSQHVVKNHKQSYKNLVATTVATTKDKNHTTPIVKMSRSHICHSINDRYYNRTTHFTPYNSMESCVTAGGRRPF